MLDERICFSGSILSPGDVRLTSGGNENVYWRASSSWQTLQTSHDSRWFSAPTQWMASLVRLDTQTPVLLSGISERKLPNSP